MVNNIKNWTKEIKNANVICSLAIKEQFSESFIGRLWIAFRAVAQLSVYAFLFTRIINPEIPKYFTYIAINFSFWMFCAQVVAKGTTFLFGSAGLLLNKNIKHSTLIISILLEELYYFAIRLIICLLIAAIIDKHIVTPIGILIFIIQMPIIVFISYVIVMMLAILYPYVKDIHNAIEIMVPVMMWFTPIFYSVERFGNGALRILSEWNIVYILMQCINKALYSGTFASIAVYGRLCVWMALLSGLYFLIKKYLYKRVVFYV